MNRIKKLLITGILVLLPVTGTFFILTFVFNLVDGLLEGPLQLILQGRNIPGLGFVVTVVLILLTGTLATNLAGRQIIHVMEMMMAKIPMVKTIYAAIKQIVEAFSIEKSGFQRVVLLEYPRTGIWAVGFVTGTIGGEVLDKTDERCLINVFVPTTPNPTSGFLLLVPPEQMVFLDMPVEDGLKLVISGGIISPSQTWTGQC